MIRQPPPKSARALHSVARDQSHVTPHFTDKRMPRRGEGRVQSSKRRQQMSLRNQYTELTVNYDEVLKENKLLKQIQVPLVSFVLNFRLKFLTLIRFNF